MEIDDASQCILCLGKSIHVCYVYNACKRARCSIGICVSTTRTFSDSSIVVLIVESDLRRESCGGSVPKKGRQIVCSQTSTTSQALCISTFKSPHTTHSPHLYITPQILDWRSHSASQRRSKIASDQVVL